MNCACRGLTVLPHLGEKSCDLGWLGLAVQISHSFFFLKWAFWTAPHTVFGARANTWVKCTPPVFGSCFDYCKSFNLGSSTLQCLSKAQRSWPYVEYHLRYCTAPAISVGRCFSGDQGRLQSRNRIHFISVLIEHSTNLSAIPIELMIPCGLCKYVE